MDVRTIWKQFIELLHRFWLWIKPYLVQFHKARKRIWKKYRINKVIILIGLLTVLITSVYLFILAKDTNVQDLKTSLKETTIIFDKNDAEAGNLGKKGTYVDLDQISPDLVNAVIATEDRNFYSHRGFDIRGIARAALRMVINRSTAGGGGSTITQQLAKNAFLVQDQTFTRKFKELFLAIELEKEFSKDEILTMYLNHAYFGQGVWGVQDASRRYFGVDATNLTIGQAATIAGMLKGPNIYNPIDNPEAANNRRDTVLNVMVETGKINQEQQVAESSVNIADTLNDTLTTSESDYRFPFYFDAIINEAESRFGIKEQDLLNKGYRVYTALDQDYQRQLDQVYANNALFPPNASDGALAQSASVVLDPSSGGVRALVGRRGDYVFRGFNFATQMQRSPGSTIKPFSVFAPALERGYKPDSILKDTPLDFYDAQNFDGTYQGEVPMYQALANSLNLPAVSLLHEIGLQIGFDKTKEFGIPLNDSDKYYGLALGGLKTGTSPLVMASAYGVFANGGTLYTPYLIRKIVDSTGAVIVDNTQSKGKQVISQDTADEMTSMLLGTFSNGTGVAANPYGFTVAGKTGTTETNFDASKANDQWIIGYTPDVVISTWLGFEESSPEHFLEGTSGQVVGRVFQAAAQGILPYTNNTSFTVADAYATGGQVVPADQVTDKQNEQQWQDNLTEYGEQAKEGLRKVGEQLRDGLRGIGDAARDLFRNFQQE